VFLDIQSTARLCLPSPAGALSKTILAVHDDELTLALLDAIAEGPPGRWSMPQVERRPSKRSNVNALEHG
jgi:hypothetical protein